MPQMLIRDIEPEMMERLKALAKANNHSLQKEVKEMLHESIEKREKLLQQRQAFENLVKLRSKILKRRKGKPFPDSTEELRKARQEWV